MTLQTSKHKLSSQSALLNFVIFYIPITYFGLIGVLRIYLDPGAYLLLATWASAATVLAFTRVVVDHKIRSMISTELWLVILSLGFAFVISSLLLQDLALPGLKSLGQPLIFGISCYLIYAKTRVFERGITLMKILLLLNALNGLRQALYGLTSAEALLLTNSGSSFLVANQSRVLGFQSSGQDFAFLAGIAFVLGTSAWLWGKHSGSKSSIDQALNLLLAAIGAVASIAALQRSVVFGIALATFAMVVNSFRLNSGRKFVLYIFAGSALLLLAGSWFLSERFALAFDRLSNSQSLGDGSFQTRSLVTIPTSLGLISDAPWFGYGLGSSGPAAVQAPNGPLFAFPLGGTIADNGYFFLMLQLGIPVTLGFLFAFSKWAFTNKILKKAAYQDVVKTVNPLIFYLFGCMVGGSFLPLTAPMTFLILLALDLQTGNSDVKKISQ